MDNKVTQPFGLCTNKIHTTTVSNGSVSKPSKAKDGAKKAKSTGKLSKKSSKAGSKKSTPSETPSRSASVTLEEKGDVEVLLPPPKEMVETTEIGIQTGLFFCLSCQEKEKKKKKEKEKEKG